MRAESVVGNGKGVGMWAQCDGGSSDDSEVALPTIIHHQAIWVFMTADRAITSYAHIVYITHQYSAKENEKRVNLVVENVLFNA